MSGKVANPAPLGLFAFGLTTVLLNFENAGISEKTLLDLVLAHGLFFGGAAQFAAGMWEFRTGNTFGATAFTSYGAFWISLASYIWVHHTGIYAYVQEIDMAIYFGVWCVFTGLLCVITTRLSNALIVVFSTLTLLFLLLLIGEYSTTVHKIAGYVGIVCGGSAFYTGWATVLNETWKATYLPLGAIAAAKNDDFDDLAKTKEEVTL
mmetsp:Transcript_58908/g.124957  ORF Transcript_58908/g.124957 Transcript_58908/m.124957 type:complete len:207 (-) Transcript_58908:103-723(-)|eukprot:CAMPEP_0206468964 /NCGR_PEP_ID=MMETSP0324_2-20121206/29971_1 /ASSEMBLY_ACC=CAM_ASM_000836 /TAXON_ID=2866 /ORGANISM="Crypthecodinium cohnii, Strain Seligo" /LENGTH=206 /DNA_ID=CAMNT_0053942579 /DNA_START=1 /DNA_END=621 /DNA_ORIENTATION=+